MTVGVASFAFSLMLAISPSVHLELDPMDDPQLQQIAEFLEPRLQVLVEGQLDDALVLEMTRLSPDRARFRLLQGGAKTQVLAEREQTAESGPEAGFDGLELWLAFKNAWARAAEAPHVRVVEPPQSAPPTLMTRKVTVAVMGSAQGDGLASFGAGLGFGRGAGETFSVAGELAYQRAPVDEALTVHHLFVQSHLGYALVDGFALEGSGRLTAQFAVAGAQNTATFDLGLGAGAHLWFGESPELWLRATVLTHPVTQRYLFDGGAREANPVTFNVAAGVGL